MLNERYFFDSTDAIKFLSALIDNAIMLSQFHEMKCSQQNNDAIIQAIRKEICISFLNIVNARNVDCLLCLTASQRWNFNKHLITLDLPRTRTSTESTVILRMHFNPFKMVELSATLCLEKKRQTYAYLCICTHWHTFYYVLRASFGSNMCYNITKTVIVGACDFSFDYFTFKQLLNIFN